VTGTADSDLNTVALQPLPPALYYGDGLLATFALFGSIMITIDLEIQQLNVTLTTETPSERRPPGGGGAHHVMSSRRAVGYFIVRDV